MLLIYRDITSSSSHTHTHHASHINISYSSQHTQVTFIVKWKTTFPNIIHSQTSYTYTTKLHYTLIKKKSYITQNKAIHQNHTTRTHCYNYLLSSTIGILFLKFGSYLYHFTLHIKVLKMKRSAAVIWTATSRFFNYLHPQLGPHLSAICYIVTDI